MIQAQESPILDRELFFGNPEISGGQLSPDGKWISFMKAYDGIMNVWVKKFDDPFEKAKPLTDSKRPLYGYFWTDDSKQILYVKDKDGDENINIFSVDPYVTIAAGKPPSSKNLTPLDSVTAQIYMVSRRNPDILMVGLNSRDKAWHDLYKLKISTGELTKIYENKDRISGYDFDWDEKLRVLYRTDEKGNTTFLRIDGKDSLTPIYETIVTEQAYISNWNEDNSKFYLVSNKGDSNLSTLFLMDPQTKIITKVESDPKGKVDFGALQIDKNTRKIISTSYIADKTDHYWKDKTWEANYKFLKNKFPGREVDFQSATNDYSKFLISSWGDKYVTETYFFDTNTKDLIFQYTPRPALKKVEKHLTSMNAILYKSSDDLEISGYLSLPISDVSKNLPLIVLVHGGPKGPRDNWGYNAQVQFLINRGYAVLQPNFRASGGYGKQFLNAGDLQWGKLMQDDITWGVKHLIEKGIADKNKIAIMGGSYGGYATLAGLAFTPDLFTCGVDIVGPSNIFTLLESVPAYWESGRAFLYGMVGDPNTSEGQKRIREASPLFRADQIVKPLLIIQGKNDPRVKKEEADQIVIALRDKGKKTTYLLADDEGHGFSKPINRMAMYAAIEKFLAEILGGRYQDEMPANIAKRLKELTVDINTVTYTQKKKVAIESGLPKINNTIIEGIEKYSITIEMHDQKIPMEMIRTVTRKNNAYIIREVSESSMGNTIDELIITEDFEPISRNMEQMKKKMIMNFTKQKVIIDAVGKKVEITLKGAYIIEGVATDLIIAGLPLTSGYTFNFETPDIMTMKSKQMTLKYIGKEVYNNISCNKIETINADNAIEKTTYWINSLTKKMEKKIMTLPALNNAILTFIKK